MAEHLQYATPSDEEATRVGGNMLSAPKEGQNLTVREYTYDNGHKTTFSKWEALCIVDDVVPKIEMDEATGLVHESVRIQLRIDPKIKQVNPGRVESDFNHFYWELSKFSDEQLEEWAKKANTSTASAEDKKKGLFVKKMQQMNFAARLMADFCKALGYHDRLASRSVFRGIAKIKDLIPHMQGKRITVVFEKGEDRNGDMHVNIRRYKKAD